MTHPANLYLGTDTAVSTVRDFVVGRLATVDGNLKRVSLLGGSDISPRRVGGLVPLAVLVFGWIKGGLLGEDLCPLCIEKPYTDRV